MNITKKIIAIFALLALTTTSLFAYDLTSKDNKLIDSITFKIEKKIEKYKSDEVKYEKVLNSFIKKLETIQNKFETKNPKMFAIVWWIIDDLQSNTDNFDIESELLSADSDSSEEEWNKNIWDDYLYGLSLYDITTNYDSTLKDTNIDMKICNSWEKTFKQWSQFSLKLSLYKLSSLELSKKDLDIKPDYDIINKIYRLPWDLKPWYCQDFKLSLGSDSSPNIKIPEWYYTIFANIFDVNGSDKEIFLLSKYLDNKLFFKE